MTQDRQGQTNWVEVLIETSVDAGELLGVLDDPGATAPGRRLDRKTILDSVGSFEPYLQRGARLLLSGILSEDRKEVSNAFSQVGGAIRASKERDGWLALEVLAPEGCEGQGQGMG